MPVLTIRFDRLNSLLKKVVSRKQILELLPFIGLDIEDSSEEEVKVEYNPNRPDYGSPAGIAKSLNYLHFGEEPRVKYDFPDSNIIVYVDESVNKVRPYIFSLYSELPFSESTLIELISLQEDLHEGIGRSRRKFAIGLHDAAKIHPPIYYKTENRDFKFVPLNSTKSMTVEEVLQQTEQGLHYSDLLSSRSRFPMIKDSKGEVLSFPPIINGNLTTLSERTGSLFIDVTATEPSGAEDALALLATTLLDYGASVFKVKIVGSSSSFTSPALNSRKMTINPTNVKRILGLPLSKEETVLTLKKVGIHASIKGDLIEADVPRHRIDILHEVDLIEEVGYGYGFNNITPLELKLPQEGKPLSSKRLHSDVRLCLIGLGFAEVMNFYLSSKEIQTPFSSTIIEVESPMAQEYDALRYSIIPQLLQVLSYNIHEQYPQKIFEIGRTFEFEEKAQGIKENVKVAALLTHPEATLTEIKSTVVSIMNYLGIREYESKASRHQYFIEGRSASIDFKGRTIGIFGEVSPIYISKASLRNPITALELNLTKLIEK